MKTLTVIALAFSLAITSHAAWKDWTTEQRTAVKTWIKTQPTEGTVALKKAINKRPVIGWNDWDENVPFNPLIVMYRREAKRIAGLAEIVKSDSDVQMDSKLQAYINNALQADKPIAVYNASKFWVAFNAVRDIDADQSATYVVHHHDPIYGQSFAQINGLGGVLGGDIEKAIRDK